MATTNLKNHNIFNTMEFKIREIKETEDNCYYLVNNIKFTEEFV